MDHYIDLRVRPDPEFSVPHLVNALAAKLHRVLVGQDAADVGVSFPRHAANGNGLGDTLRLHGGVQRLRALMQSGWLGSMSDHVFPADVVPVPEGCAYRVVRRVQAHSSAERIRRRQMKRHGWSAEEARARIPDSVEQQLSLPYLTLSSSSTGQKFRLFIEHMPCQGAAQPGSFNAYGLSPTATVPWF